MGQFVGKQFQPPSKRYSLTSLTAGPCRWVLLCALDFSVVELARRGAMRTHSALAELIQRTGVIPPRASCDQKRAAANAKYFLYLLLGQRSCWTDQWVVYSCGHLQLHKAFFIFILPFSPLLSLLWLLGSPSPVKFLYSALERTEVKRISLGRAGLYKSDGNKGPIAGNKRNGVHLC